MYYRTGVVGVVSHWGCGCTQQRSHNIPTGGAGGMGAAVAMGGVMHAVSSAEASAARRLWLGEDGVE